MKIILISSYPDSIISFRGDLIKEMLSENHEVHVISSGFYKNSDVLSHLSDLRCNTHECSLKRKGLSPISDLIYLFKLINLFLKIKPDITFAYTIKPVIYASIAAKICNVPRVFSLITGLGSTFADNTSRSTFFIQMLIRRMYRVSLKNTSGIFFQNPDDLCLFIEYGLISPESNSIVVNGSGVNLKYYSASTPPNKISFLLISRIMDQKGIREFVAAAQKIKSTHKEVEFVLAGWHDGKSISKEELKVWVDSGVIIFLGKLKDVRTAIKNCSIFVLPSSYREGIPRTVLEALSIGRAVITSRTPGCKETVHEGVNGYLVTPKSVRDIEDAMMKFIHNPKLIYSMGKASRKIAEERFDVDNVNNIMLKQMGI
jgi:glycosyltransferase involved in cell wall biosynthesis